MTVRKTPKKTEHKKAKRTTAKRKNIAKKILKMLAAKQSKPFTEKEKTAKTKDNVASPVQQGGVVVNSPGLGAAVTEHLHNAGEEHVSGEEHGRPADCDEDGG